MDPREPITAVSNATGLPSDEAERAVRATVRPSSSASAKRSRRLIEELPPELRRPPHLARIPAREFDEADFDRRIARQGVTTPEGREHAREVVALPAERAGPEAWGPVEAALRRFYPAVLSHVRMPPRRHKPHVAP